MDFKKIGKKLIGGAALTATLLNPAYSDSFRYHFDSRYSSFHGYRFYHYHPFRYRRYWHPYSRDRLYIYIEWKTPKKYNYEREMRNAVCDWLRRKGIIYFVEYPIKVGENQITADILVPGLSGKNIIISLDSKDEPHGNLEDEVFQNEEVIVVPPGLTEEQIYEILDREVGSIIRKARRSK